MKRLVALLFALALAGATQAQDGPAAEAEAAARMLEEATRALDDASAARDRVKALTQTVRAYEAGLQAMREGLRRAAVRQQALERDLAAREEEIAQLLGVLQSMSHTPAPVTMLHPTGPVGAARSGMILADVTPGLNARVVKLRAKLDDLVVLRALQDSAANRLEDGLRGAQAARAALSQAIADRTDLPRRFTEDPVKTALLIASTESLDGFASGLSQIAADPTGAPGPAAELAKGSLPLPVQGRLLRGAGEADAAGIKRPGILVAAPPRALVTAPAAATLRYRGPLLDYGDVAILEPRSGLLIVLAGMETTFGETGEVLPAGSPVGLMGGLEPDDDGIVPARLQDPGSDWTQTLYIEVRQDNTPVDPAQWFRTDKDD
ncbi:peptidase M23 [Roseovarius spongiae]|uniref:Peptidase M23 n=1 Tax=Roseovarius spongiae TaxID=2320272 RepID=A0A3A8B4U8_9RHOB|nr:peptidoglycan DD-metalloendopeptidase family protein [Roseovarius spongiae]RKF13839.1 peptidase M23 [Roseovarius spongiae]